MSRTRNRSLSPRMGRALVMCAVLLMVVGTVSQAEAASPSLTVASGPSPFATCPLLPPQAQAYLHIETEPRLAANPSAAPPGRANLVGVWIQDAQAGDIAAYSFDGGATWDETLLPFTVCAPGGLPYQRALDPWISIGPDGRAYATGLVLTPGSAAGSVADMAVAAATSTDGGRTWSNVHAFHARHNPAGLATLLDKPTVTADPVKAGTAYAVWQEEGAGTASPPVAWFAKTTNGGRTWSRPKIIIPTVKGSGAYYHEIVADTRSQRLYDVFNLVRPQLRYHKVCKTKGTQRTCRKVGAPVPGKFNGYIAFIASADRGKTWSTPHIISEDRAIGIVAAPGGQLTVGAGIDATFDPASGRIYVIWTDARFTNLMYDEVVISSSGDKGAHWTAPRAVSTAAISFNPTVAVNAAGAVAVTYYDLRDVASNPATILVDLWFATSADKGASFGNETKLCAFDISTAPVVNGGYFIGDYAGLASVGDIFMPFFVMTTGQPANPTDVYTTSVGP
jgi:hypothetical protein